MKKKKASGDHQKFLIHHIKKVKNPNYKGKWKTPWIDNPEIEDDPDLYVLRPTKYVGIEIWQAEKEAFEEAGKVRKAREEEVDRMFSFI
ncbi:Calreticulin [Capsicum baccatum]|uniref:Calreticulin n=1 Tax=Capsicum baccatum TaxID=33114 RepID=A0A2G2UVE9_CAPBA|nr:Calreticulin [Capsicum baccatum]